MAVSLAKQLAEQDYIARSQRRVSQGFVRLRDDVTRTVVLDVGQVNALGNSVYMRDIPFQAQTPPQVNDTVTISYANASPHSASLSSGQVGGGNVGQISEINGTNLVVTNPATSVKNFIVPTGTGINALTVKAFGSYTGSMFQIQDSSANLMLDVAMPVANGRGTLRLYNRAGGANNLQNIIEGFNASGTLSSRYSAAGDVYLLNGKLGAMSGSTTADHMQFIYNARTNVYKDIWMTSGTVISLFNSGNTKTVNLSCDNTTGGIVIQTANTDTPLTLRQMNWNTPTPALILQAPGTLTRTRLWEFGNFEINCTGPNTAASADWDVVNLCSANIDPVTAFSGNFFQGSINSKNYWTIDATGNETFRRLSSTSTSREAFSWEASLPTATDATRLGEMVGYTWGYNGKHEAMRFTDANSGGSGQANASLFGNPGYGGGRGIFSLKDATAAPSSNPTAGVQIYSNSGVLTWRDPSGNVYPLNITGASGVTSLNGLTGAFNITGGAFISVSVVGGNIQITGSAPNLVVNTKGDLLGYSTVPARVAVGVDRTFLMADSSAALGVSYQTPDMGWVKYSFTPASFSIAALTNNVVAFSLPSKAMIHGIIVKHGADWAYAGGNTSTLVSVGLFGNATAYTNTLQIHSAPSNVNYAVKNSAGFAPESFTGATNIYVFITNNTANLNAAFTGSPTLDIWFQISQLT